MAPWLVLLLLVAPMKGADEGAPLWLTFDVLNPETTGKHRILHLDDLLAAHGEVSSALKRAGDLASLPAAKSVLLLTTTLDTCLRKDEFSAAIEGLAQAAREQGGLLVVMLVDGSEALPEARMKIAQVRPAFPVVGDAFSIARVALNLSLAGEAVVIHSDGKLTRLGRVANAAPERRLAEIRAEYLRDLARDKQGEE